MKKEKDGGERRRGSGHHSLSQLTQPSGVALSLSLSLSPSTSLAPPSPHLSASLIPASSSVETEGEGSVWELTMAVHFTVGLGMLRKIEANAGGGSPWWPLKSWFQTVKLYLQFLNESQNSKRTLNGWILWICILNASRFTDTESAKNGYELAAQALIKAISLKVLLPKCQNGCNKTSVKADLMAF